MTQFFTQIEQYITGCDLQLVISKKDETISVSVLPKANVKDEALKNILPLHLSGTAEELNNGFFEAISQPMQKTAGLITNIAQYEKNLEVAASKSASAKAQEDEKKKEEEAKKKEAALRKKKFDKLVEKSEQLVKSGELKKAIGALKESKKFTDKPDAIDKKIQDVVIKLSSAGSLFDIMEEVKTIETNFEADITEELDKEEKKTDASKPKQGTKRGPYKPRAGKDVKDQPAIKEETADNDEQAEVDPDKEEEPEEEPIEETNDEETEDQE